MKLKVSKIVGASNSKTWCQVHDFLPIDKGEHLMAALSFKAKKEGIEVSSFGTEIIKRLQELYYTNESDGVLKKISQVMESLAAEFLIEVDLEMVLMVVIEVAGETILYAGRNNGGQVFLRRENQLVALIDGENEGLGVVSGKLKFKDSLVAGTSQFFKIVPEGVINSALEQEEVEQIIESLASVVHGHENNSRAAAVVARNLPEKVEEGVDSKIDGARHSPGKIREDSVDLGVFTPKKLIGGVWGVVWKQVKQLRSRVVRVRDRDPKKQKNAATIALVLVLVFGVSLVMAGKKSKRTRQEEKLTQTLEEVNYKYDEALGLIELNPLRAKSLLKESLETIKLLEAEEGELGEEMLSLKTKIDIALADVSRDYKVESGIEWFDFSLIKEGFKASDFEAEGNKVLVWDQDLKTVIEVDLASKASKIVAGGETINGGSLVGLAGERGFVVNKDNITVVDTDKEEVVALVAIEPTVAGQVEGGIRDAVGFSSNLYLLDGVSNGQIYKYLGVSSGLSSKRNYLTGESYDLSEAVSMAIDGSVWVLFSDGTIVKYVRGVKDAFVIAGLDKGFEEPVKIFTSPEVENLYILDRRSMRVVVIAKNGEYKSQYVWPGIAGVDDLAVSEELGKIFLLTKEKIFVIELKQ